MTVTLVSFNSRNRRVSIVRSRYAVSSLASVSFDGLPAVHPQLEATLAM